MTLFKKKKILLEMFPPFKVDIGLSNGIGSKLVAGT